MKQALFTDCNETVYTTGTVNIRTSYTADSKSSGSFSTMLCQFSLKYILYSCVKLASSGEKISHRRAHFHFSNSA